jgi:hypothetical protein
MVADVRRLLCTDSPERWGTDQVSQRGDAWQH